MPRRAIELERTGLRTPRERMWSAMKALVEFTPTQIEDKAHPITRDAVRSYLAGLEAAGYVVQMQANARQKRGFSPSVYKVVKFAAITPQLDKQGRPIQGLLGVVAMWRAMKIRKTFDALQICTDATQGTVTCSLGTAKAYITRLAAVGYLRLERAASNSGKGTLARWRLVKDTGPQPPAVTRAKAVFDRNTGELLLAETPQEVCDALE